MTDEKKFKIRLMSLGFTLNDVAKKLGISVASLSYKVNNKREFKVSEIQKLQCILNLTSKERDEIFLHSL